MSTIKHLLENFCSLWQKWSVKLLLSLLLFWQVKETLSARLCKSAEQFHVNEGYTVGQWAFSCDPNNARAKIFMQKDVCAICVSIHSHRNWETIVFFRMRMIYGIVYLDWAACRRVSSKMEPSRRDKSKIKSISTQLSWMRHIERQVPSNSHRERVAFLGVGKAMRRNTGRLDCPQPFILGACRSGGKLAAEAGPRGKSAVPPSLARRDRAGPVKPSSANSVVTTRQGHVVTRQVQSQAQHIYNTAYVQCSSGKVKFSPGENSLGRKNVKYVSFSWETTVKWSAAKVHCGGEEGRLEGVCTRARGLYSSLCLAVMAAYGLGATIPLRQIRGAIVFKAKEFRRQSLVFPPSLSVEPYCLHLHLLSSCPV